MESFNLGAYGKSITYIALTALSFLVTAFADNNLSNEELINLGVVVVGAIGVYALPNFPNSIAKYAKSGLAFLTAGLVAMLSFFSDGISPTEWMQILLAAFAAIGVYVVPNVPEKPVQAVEVVNSTITTTQVAPEGVVTVTTPVPVGGVELPVSDAGLDGETGEPLTK